MKRAIRNVVLSTVAFVLTFTTFAGINSIEAANDFEEGYIRSYGFRVYDEDGNAGGPYEPLWRHDDVLKDSDGNVIEGEDGNPLRKYVQNIYYRMYDEYIEGETQSEESISVAYCIHEGKADPDHDHPIVRDGDYKDVLGSAKHGQMELVMSAGYPSVSGSHYGVSDRELEWATAVALKIVEGNAYNKDGVLQSSGALDINKFPSLSSYQSIGDYIFSGFKPGLEDLVSYDFYDYDDYLLIEFGKGTSNEDTQGIQEFLDKREEAIKVADLVQDILYNSELNRTFVSVNEASGFTETIVQGSETSSNFKVLVGPYRLDASNEFRDVSNETFDLTSQLGSGTSNLRYLDASGNVKATFKEGDEVYLEATVERGKTFEVNIQLTSKSKSFDGVEYFHRNVEGEQTMAVPGFSKPTASTLFRGNETLPLLYTISFIKKDLSDGTLLAGVEFDLQDEDGNVVRSGVTNINGVIKFDDLPQGLYKLIETKQLDGYIKGSVKNIEITHDGKLLINGEEATGNESIINNAKNKITIYKVDKDQSIVFDATIRVVNRNTDEVIYEGVLDTGQLELSGLPEGEYDVFEINAPSGYLINKTKYGFSVNENGVLTLNQDTGQEGAIRIINEKNTFKIHKVDTDTGESLASAVFEVEYTNSDGERITELYTTNAQGIIKFEGLEHATYTIKEVESPFGYELDGTVYTIEVTQDGIRVVGTSDYTDTLTVENRKVEEPKEFETYIFKVDENGNRLEGATVKVVNKDTGEVVYEGELPKDGLKLTLKSGNYAVTEIKAPEGYEISDKDLEFTIDEDGNHVGLQNINDVLSLDLVNNKIEEPEPKEFETYIFKVDENGNRLEGATVKVVNKDTGEVVYEGELPEDGLQLTLKSGNYAVTEIKAPEGYEIADKDLEFTIDEDGNHVGLQNINDVLSLDLVNNKIEEPEPEPERFETYIFKVDEDGNRLKGATVIIYNKDTGAIVYDGELPEDGLVLSLLPGNYAITEIKSPEGYNVSDKDLEFTIDKDGNHIGLQNIDDVLSIDLVNTKIVEEPEEPETPEVPVEEVPEPEAPIVPTGDTGVIFVNSLIIVLMSLFAVLGIVFKRKQY